LPTIVIGPSKGWARFNLKELWEYRELLYFLIWRDVKVRYKQTVFGAAWAIAQPLMLMVVFSIFLGHLARVPSNGLPYPLFAYSGLVPWTLFSSALNGASGSLVGSSNLISKVYFPRLLLPLASAGPYVIDFMIAMVVLIGMMVFYGAHVTVGIFWLPAFVLIALMAAMAVGVWLAAANVRYRDVRHAAPFMVQLWLFASPVAYASSIVPRKWRLLYSLNPMTGVIEGFRWALLGAPPPSPAAILVSLASVMLILVTGVAYFRRVEQTFADVI